MTTSSKTSEWGPIRKLFWPIFKSEHGKFIPMLLIYSLVVFNYSILKAAKDALVITAPGSGASTIPYIKLWAILPMAFLSTLIFTRLANKYSRHQVFYFIISGFLIFFALFTFVLYPGQEFLHPHQFCDMLQTHLPKGLQGLVAIFRNWTFTLFYVMCELWGTIIMSVLFWGFANEVTSVKEAKRFYAILGVGANLGTIIAGRAGIFLSSEYLFSKLHWGADRWEQSLIMTTLIILTIGLAAMAIYRLYAHKAYDSAPGNHDPLEMNGKKDEKPIKMGIRKNFAYIAKSKYLLCIAVLVLTFNISLNMIEVVWKDQVHMLCPYPADYSVYMNKVLTYVGILSTIFAIFVCGQVIRRYGWMKSAYLTPVIMLITGVLFFSFAIFRDVSFFGMIASMMGTTPLILSAFFGSMQNTLARSSKFTFFDVTKEMAFIPLSNECKLKGKAAIDGVGSRLGKSGGSLIHQCLLIFFGTVSASTPIVAVILFVVIIAWIFAVRSLGHQFAEHQTDGEKIDIKEDEETESVPGSAPA